MDNILLLMHHGNGQLEDAVYLWDHESRELEVIASSIDELEKS